MSRALPLLLVLASITMPTSAQTRIDWYTVDGGGGESAAGRYVMRGSVGQVDADEVSLCSPDGGSACVQPRYEISGGYWSGPNSLAPVNDELFKNGFES